MTLCPQSHIRDYLFFIGTCQNKTELRILESLHILQSKPTLSCTQSAHPLNIIKINFLYAFSFFRDLSVIVFI